MVKLCTPAIIYLLFSFTQILIDTFKGLYNTALIKIIVMVMITYLLQILCDRGLNIVSWIIVFIPFILMTVIVTMILYIFGLDASTGTVNYRCKDSKYNNVHIDKQGNVKIYDPYYDSNNHPVYFKYPNVIVPTPPTHPYVYNGSTQPSIYSSTQLVPPPQNYSSSPMFQ
jgi:hypothetical protein